MQLCHTFSRSSVRFDEPTLVSSAWLVPLGALAERASLRQLADAQLTVPGDKGDRAGSKVCAACQGPAPPLHATVEPV